ncbi:MAG: electron transport complex subunit RsxC [Pseudomonadota bacterium]
MSLSTWWQGLRPGLALAPEVLQGSAEEPAGLRRVPLPERLAFPLHHPGGWPLTPVVKVGDQVRFGETLAEGPVGSALSLHAAAAGTVLALGEHPVIDPVVENARCIVIATQPQDHAPWLAPIAAPEQAPPPALRARAGEAGLMGMGGAQFPTVTKLELAAAAGVHTLIVNGAECDPSLTCDQWLMQSYSAQIVRGARLLLHACGAERCVLPLEDDKPAAVAAMAEAVAEAGDPCLEVIPVAPRYPAGGERQLIERLFGVEVPTETWPVDAGYVSFNVATAAAFDDAVRQGQPLTERIISIAGPGVAQPGNVIAPLGSSIAHLIEHGAGGYREGASRLVVGGAMMGIAMASDEAPITAASNGLLVLTDVRTHAARRRQGTLPCIRCGDCASVCPARLQPQELFRQLQADDVPGATALHIVDCIECGSCDTVCPSQIPLTEAFRQSKRRLARAQREVQRADRWRSLFEQRNARLATDERAQAARASRRAAQTARPTPEISKEAAAVNHVPGRPRTQANEDDRQAVIRAAVERARARRRTRSTPGTDS